MHPHGLCLVIIFLRHPTHSFFFLAAAVGVAAAGHGFLDDEVERLLLLPIKACFRYPRIHRDLTGAFGFVADIFYCLATSMVFGSTTSASSWEPFRCAIEAMTSILVGKNWAGVGPTPNDEDGGELNHAFKKILPSNNENDEVEIPSDEEMIADFGFIEFNLPQAFENSNNEGTSKYTARGQRLEEPFLQHFFDRLRCRASMISSITCGWHWYLRFCWWRTSSYNIWWAMDHSFGGKVTCLVVRIS